MTDPTEIVLATIRAVEQRDVDALAELCHDDVEFFDAPSLPYGGQRRGKDELRADVQAAPNSWFGTWGPLQPTPAERRMDARVVAAHDDEVAVLYRQRALSPAGERLDAPVFALYQVRDGKFARADVPLKHRGDPRLPQAREQRRSELRWPRRLTRSPTTCASGCRARSCSSWLPRP
jgi:ketosteroid isomerase-like protein